MTDRLADLGQQSEQRHCLQDWLRVSVFWYVCACVCVWMEVTDLCVCACVSVLFVHLCVFVGLQTVRFFFCVLFFAKCACTFVLAQRVGG